MLTLQSFQSLQNIQAMQAPVKPWFLLPKQLLLPGVTAGSAAPAFEAQRLGTAGQPADHGKSRKRKSVARTLLCPVMGRRPRWSSLLPKPNARYGQAAGV